MSVALAAMLLLNSAQSAVVVGESTPTDASASVASHAAYPGFMAQGTAGAFKCEANGSIVYSDRPCKEGRLSIIDVKPASGPASESQASTRSTRMNLRRAPTPAGLSDADPDRAKLEGRSRPQSPTRQREAQQQEICAEIESNLEWIRSQARRMTEPAERARVPEAIREQYARKRDFGCR